MRAFIGFYKNEIALSELIVVPRFLRFNQVLLEHSTYPINSQLIDEKCESFRGFLSSIKSTLYDSIITNFYCQINQEDPNAFSNHSTLLEHIRQIVSICDSSRGYSFAFTFQTDSDAFGNLIASILEMPAIARSSTVYIAGNYNYYGLAHLPVETISNWLNRERHAMDQNQRHRRLELELDSRSNFVQDTHIQEMCDFLKQVSFLFPNILRKSSNYLHSIS